MESSPTPSLWLEASGSGALPGGGWSVDGRGIDCLRVAAWTAAGSSGSHGIELGSLGPRDGLLSGLRRSNRRGCAIDELLEELDGGTALAVVPSDAGNALAVVAEARRLGMLERLWVTSDDLAVLDVVRADSPATRLLHTCDPTHQPKGAERHAAALREIGVQGVMVPTDRVGAGLVALMHRFGRIVGTERAEHDRMVRAALVAGIDIVCGPSARVLREIRG